MSMMELFCENRYLFKSLTILAEKFIIDVCIWLVIFEIKD